MRGPARAMPTAGPRGCRTSTASVVMDRVAQGGRQVPTLAHVDAFEVEPSTHLVELVCERVGHLEVWHTRLGERPRNAQEPRLTVGLQIDARDDPIAHEER